MFEKAKKFFMNLLNKPIDFEISLRSGELEKENTDTNVLSTQIQKDGDESWIDNPLIFRIITWKIIIHRRIKKNQ